jgi:hypothetical protein
MFYARTKNRILPVTPLKPEAKVELVDNKGAQPGESIDLTGLEPNRLGKFDPSFGFVFAYPRGTESQHVEESDIQWGHHLLPFAYPASRCIRQSYGGSLIVLN